MFRTLEQTVFNIFALLYFAFIALFRTQEDFLRLLYLVIYDENRENNKINNDTQKNERDRGIHVYCSEFAKGKSSREFWYLGNHYIFVNYHTGIFHYVSGYIHGIIYKSVYNKVDV